MTGSAHGRVAAEASASVIALGITTTDNFGANATVSSKPGFFGSAGLLLGSPKRWEVALTGEFTMLTFNPPADVSMTPDNLNLPGARLRIIRHLAGLDAFMGASYRSHPVLLLSNTAALELKSALLPGFGIGFNFPFTKSSGTRVVLTGSLGYNLGSEAKGDVPKLGGGIQYQAGLLVEFGLKRRLSLHLFFDEERTSHDRTNVTSDQTYSSIRAGFRLVIP